MSESDVTKCPICKNAVLYGSRHHACGSYVMVMEKQIEQHAKELEALRGALINIVNTYDEYRGRGVSPAPVEYANVVESIEKSRLVIDDQPSF